MFTTISGRLLAALLMAAVAAPAANAATPGTTMSNRAITGLAMGDMLLGIDRRPVDRQLSALGRSGNAYRRGFTPSAYVAINLGTLSAALTGNGYGFDFNPTVDRLRLVSGSNQNLRINTNTMPPGTIVDGALTLNGQTWFDLLAAAHTNSRPGAITARLFGIDARSGGLLRSTNANAGASVTYVTTDLMGMNYQSLGLPLDNPQMVGFDISGNTELGYFKLGSDLYGANLATGAGTLLGSIGAGSLVGLAAGTVPEPQSWAMLIAGFGLVGAAKRRGRRNSERAAV